MADNSFFDESREQSAVKARIVTDYFWAWAKIIASTVRGRGDMIGYIDLFAGPGRYRDGSDSTPLLVLRKAIDDPMLSEMLVSIFNDHDAACAQSLEKAIQELPGIEKLKHRPIVRNEAVGERFAQLFK
ncbi:MAG: three-Cys-motif partner protein TcmP [Phycisphaerae bacterium]